MARAVAILTPDVIANGDDTTYRFRVVFSGSDLPAPDASHVDVTVGPTDTLSAAEAKIVDAVMAEAGRLGYALARERVVYPAMKRGS